MTALRPHHRCLLGLLLFGMVLALFSPSLRYGLVDFDDHIYVASTPLVMEGFSLPHVRSAFISFQQGTYAPLLWISYGTDAALWDASPANPRGFHFTNVLLHALNSVLLFLLLFACGKKPWRAFFFAALWAFHPLRVESVAWIAERKDVLSGFFGLLCLWTYVRAWPQKTGTSASARGVFLRTGIPLLFCALGLLVKPSLVPIPGALLLLDFWPLRRLDPTFRSVRARAPRLLAEKIPFFLLAALASFGASAAHQAMSGLPDVPLPVRLSAIPIHYVFYLAKTVFPRHLSPLYPDLDTHLLAVVLSSLLLLALTAWVWRARQPRPERLAGWLLFLGFLAPAIGIVRFGAQSIADRFTYFPAIGLSIALLYLWPSSNPRRTGVHFFRLCISLAVLGGLATATVRLLPAWRSPSSFHAHILAIFPNNPLALEMRSSYLIRTAGNFTQADEGYDRILQAGAYNHHVLVGKAQCLSMLQGPAAAKAFLLQAPASDNPYAQNALLWDIARYSLMLRQYDDAIRVAQHALQLPSEIQAAPAYLHLLVMAAAFEKEDLSLALAHARRFPAYADKSSLELADLLPYYLHQWSVFHRADAYAYFQRLIQTHPDQTGLLNNIAWGLATADWSPASSAEVLSLAQQVCATLPMPTPGALDTLASAQANAGDHSAAIQTVQEALDLLPDGSDSRTSAFRERLLARQNLYRQNQPYREKAFSRLMALQFGQGLPVTNENPAP